ncbi:MAG: DUF456 domain-containing protein [Alphaproteobacteria bacterium]|nr:DUF456 domain-containing protein [Alphaproteobacteria bacterium]
MIAAAIVFMILGGLCTGLVLLGLPGTWMMLALAIVIELADGWWLDGATTTTFGGWLIAGMVVVALIGEGLELASGAIGTKSGGGTRRGMIGSMAGGFLGGIVLTFMLPIPILGTLIGVLVGTFVGAYVGETSGEQAKAGDEAIKPAISATIARVVGNVAKTGVAMVVWAALTVAAFMG